MTRSSADMISTLGAFAMLLLLPISLGPVLAAASGDTPPAFLEIGRTKQLFVDSYIIQSLTDARQVINQPTKHPNNPVVKQDRAWEGNLITGSVIWDEEAQLYKMWYSTAQYVVGIDRIGRVMDVPKDKRLRAYAVSRDG